MHYFVTGATGFIGKRLVKTLLARRGAIVHFLLRPESEDKVPALLEYWGVDQDARDAGLRRPDEQEARRGGRGHQGAEGPDRPPVPPGRGVRPRRPTRRARSRSTSRARATRSSSPRRSTPGTCTTSVSIAAAGLYEGVFREDMFDEAEGLDHPYFMTKHESEKIVRKECKVPWTVYRPAMVVGDSTTGEMDKIDGPYYFFKLIQRMRQILPPWMPGDRPRRRAHQHRAGGLRRRRARPHQPPPCARQRQVLPPGRPGGLPRRRRARHLQQGRARAEDEPVRQRRAVRLHPEEREEGADGAGAGAPHPQRGDEGPRPARGHVHLRQLPDALRPPRDRRRAEGQRHRVPEPARLRLAAVGLLGAPPRPGAVHRPQPARARSAARWCWSPAARRASACRRRASSPRPAR